MPKYFTSADGLRLAYDDRGAGHPLVCMAGLSRNMDDFAHIADRYSDRVRVIRLDTRGRGASDYDPDPSNYNLMRESQDLLELLTHLELDKVSILGTSRGGLIAMGMALTQPERLHGAILNDIGPVVEAEGFAEILGYIGQNPVFTSHEDAARRLPAAAAKWFRNVSHETWLAHARALWDETPDGLRNRYDPDLRTALPDVANGAELPQIWPMFDALSQLPVALVRGANSNILSAGTAAEMCRRKPDMIFAEIPDRGHVPFLNEPAALAAIDTYLDRVL